MCALVERLQEQQPAGGGLEVVVALDGDLDGTEAALRALEVPRPPVLVRLPSTGRDAAHGHGAGPTRNAGAARATGEVLLFLDDDVRPLRPDLVARHARGHAGARRALVGTIVGEPAAGDRFLTRVVDEWWRAQTRHVEQDRALSFTDVSTGNLSVGRASPGPVGRGGGGRRTAALGRAPLRPRPVRGARAARPRGTGDGLRLTPRGDGCRPLARDAAPALSGWRV